MSSELFNAENRNSNTVVPVRRCCSFCKNPGHNITTCNDNRLYDFERQCIENYTNMSSANIFKSWLLECSVNNHNLIKAYAIRYCGCSTRSYIYLCIDQILIRINNIYNNLINQQINHEETSQSIEVIQPAEPSQPLYVQENNVHLIGGRLSPLVLSLMGQRTFTSQELVAISVFMNLIENMSENYNQQRRFNIETKIIGITNTEQCDCNICYETIEKEKFIKLNCGHEFCKECIKKTLQNVRTETPNCAFCRVEIKKLEMTSEIIRDEFNELLV
jgi:hypothetical protein